MDNTYSWDFGTIERLKGPDNDGHEDVITVIHWTYKAENNEGVVATTVNSTMLIREEGDDSWTDYADIEKADLISWVEADMGEDRIAKLQTRLDADIELRAHPTHETDHIMPWEAEEAEA